MPYLTPKQAENLQSIAEARDAEVPTVAEMAHAVVGWDDDARHKGVMAALQNLAPIINPEPLTPDEYRGHCMVLEGILDVDLDDCTPEYAAAYREAWTSVYQLLKGDDDNA